MKGGVWFIQWRDRFKEMMRNDICKYTHNNEEIDLERWREMLYVNTLMTMKR